MDGGLQPPLAASATKAPGLTAGQEPARFPGPLHSPSTFCLIILDTDTRPSAALEALCASAHKTLRVLPCRRGGYAASHRIRYGFGPAALSRG